MPIEPKPGLVVLLCVLVSACSLVGIGPRPSTDVVNSPSEASAKLPSDFNSQILETLPVHDRRVYITKIYDDRGPTPKDITVAGAVMLKGDMSTTLREILKESLRAKGVKLGFVRTPLLSGRLLDWYATTSSHTFVESVSAKAVLELSLYSPDNSSVYRGIYTGETTRTILPLMNSRIHSTLDSALQEAIDEAASDPRLLEQIEQYSS